MILKFKCHSRILNPVPKKTEALVWKVEVERIFKIQKVEIVVDSKHIGTSTQEGQEKWEQKHWGKWKILNKDNMLGYLTDEKSASYEVKL